METIDLPLKELNARAYAALVRELGPRGFVQFVSQFRPGRGDWTLERHLSAANEPLEKIAERLRDLRKNGNVAGRQV